jgi:1,5-anhydro-D-fructose reductase (1,5-anhydro-D-mannitol-forming)
MKTVRYALLGFGGIARLRIAREGFGLGPGFAAPAGAELVAAHDPEPAGREAAAAWGLAWHAEADSILNDPGIDAVFIASTNSTHAPLARRALEAGKHCLIEKPIATTLADAEALVALANSRGLSLAVDHMMTQNGFNAKAREMIAHGALGAVGSVCLHMEFQYGSTPAEAASWRCARPEELGGPVGDVGSHCLYMAEYLLGSRITALSAVYTPRTQTMNVENGATISFETAAGIRGGARVSFAENRGGLLGTLSNLGFEIYGDQGVLRAFGTLFQLSGGEGEPVRLRLELETAADVRQIAPAGVPNIYRAIIEDHAGSIRNGTPMTGEDGLRNLRLILAVHESANNHGKRVVL